MQVKDVMSKDPHFVKPDVTLRDAAQVMRDHDVGCLPVGEHDRLTGMLTDRDIAVRAVAEGRNPDTTKVSDVMSPGIRYCFEDETLDEAAKRLESSKIRRLVVLNRDKRLTGILSVSDFATQGNDRKLAGRIESAVCHKAA